MIILSFYSFLHQKSIFTNWQQKEPPVNGGPFVFIIWILKNYMK